MKLLAIKSKSRRGASLVELLLAAVILSFMVAATATLFTVGHKQQNVARYYSEVQTNLRTSLRKATRTLRHGFNVVGTSSASNFSSGATSNESRIIVRVPEPTGASTADIEFRLYVSSNVLYIQRADVSAPGTALMSGVQNLTINYFRTIAGTRTAVDGAPATATEAQLTLTASYGSVTTSVTAYVALRNAITSL